MSKPDLDDIRARWPSNGEWWSRDGATVNTLVDGGDEVAVAECVGGSSAERHAEFIAYAPNDIYDLLTYIGELENQIERVRELHQRVETRSHYPMPPNWEHQKLVVCGHCKHAGDAAHPYPCPTIEALGGDGEHRMIAGSHERRTGPVCVCGGVWNYWIDKCEE